MAHLAQADLILCQNPIVTTLDSLTASFRATQDQLLDRLIGEEEYFREPVIALLRDLYRADGRLG